MNMLKEQLPHLMPFLWVHGEDEATYRRMIKVIDEANLRAFCVEARPHKEFCEDRWWRDMDIILDEAGKRGMKVWILDDKHFPTGFANGKAMEAPPELRRQGLFLKTFSASGRIRLNLSKNCHPKKLGRPAMYVLTDLLMKNHGKACRFDDDRVLGVSAISVDHPDTPMDLSSYVRDGVLDWTAPEGRWTVQLCCLSRNLGVHRNYINMMDRESCRILLDAVYEPHYAHYKDLFGSVIVGFFSDEPELGNNYLYRQGNVLGTDQDLPWSRELEKALKERLGECFASLLPLLWNNDCEPGLTARVRYDYMDCVTRLVEEDFSHQIGSWCREHRVEYIGHVIEDNDQHARTGTSLGHYFRGLKWQSMAGIDDIGGQVYPGGEDSRRKNFFGYYEDGEFYHYVLGKLGSSLGAVNPNMQGRTMCEIFGNYGWSEGVRLEKYLVDHFMVRGVNHFVPHAFTCSPYPEKDCPPHFYAQGNNPQYRHFAKLMEYTDRVCRLISGGKASTPVAILYHGEAEWTGKCMPIQKAARVCLNHQIDFHFIPADVFTERCFYDTKITATLTVNGNVYQTLVLPYAQFITPQTSSAIWELLAAGGKVLFIKGLPEGLTSGGPLPDRIKNVPVVSLAELAGNLAELSTVMLDPADDRIRALHYLGSEDLVYLFNEGDSAYEGSIRVPISGSLCAYNAWDDRYETLETTEFADAENAEALAASVDIGQTIRVTLPPHHSLFIVPANARELQKPLTMHGNKQTLSSFTQSVCRSIDYPNFTGEKAILAPESYHLTDPKFSGFIRYETEFTAGECFTALEITDAYEGVEVFVNGISAGIQILPPYRYDLTGFCSPDRNRLTIEVATTLERERSGGKKGASSGITGSVYLYTE